MLDPLHVIMGLQHICLLAHIRTLVVGRLDYLNFGLAKGMAYERVLIVPTAGIIKFIQSSKHLEPKPAASFYVAITRAAQSVAIVIQESGNSELPFWEP